MNIVIQSTLKTLEKSKSILENLADDDLCNASVSPYYSSIGTHIRHILDFYDCVLNKDSENVVDLTARSRNKQVESCCDTANEYLSVIEDKLKTLKNNVGDMVTVKDDLGMGRIELPYTYGALLAQANSHTIHHYAIISYIFDRLGIVFDDTDFGYNPTTPKQTAID